MRIRYAALADFSSITADGKLNILGIFDQIHAAKFPCTHQHFHMVGRIQADSISDYGKEHILVIEHVDSDGKVLKKIEIPATLPKQSDGIGKYFSLNFDFRDTIFPSPGPYVFRLKVDDSVYEIDITIKKHPATNAKKKS